MPKLNPYRPIIESYFRVPIRELFWQSSGIPGQPREHVIGPVSLKIWTLPDDNGVIEIGNRRWAVQYHPRSQWNNNADEFCSDYWVIGSNGKRHSYLLVGEDGSCATRSELSAHYQSEHIYSRNRVIKKRGQILDALKLENVDPANLDLHYVPLLEKPKGIHWTTWKRQEQMRVGYKFVPVKRPKKMRVKRFEKLLRYLNKNHKPKGKGEQTMAELDRVFGGGR
jgi:hypothetical protein